MEFFSAEELKAMQNLSAETDTASSDAVFLSQTLAGIQKSIKKEERYMREMKDKQSDELSPIESYQIPEHKDAEVNESYGLQKSIKKNKYVTFSISASKDFNVSLKYKNTEAEYSNYDKIIKLLKLNLQEKISPLELFSKLLIDRPGRLACDIYYQFRANYIKMKINRSFQNQDDLGDIKVDHTGHIISDIPDLDYSNLISSDNSVGIKQEDILKTVCKIVKEEIKPEIECFLENEVYFTSQSIQEHLYNIFVNKYLISDELLKISSTKRASQTGLNSILCSKDTIDDLQSSIIQEFIEHDIDVIESSRSADDKNIINHLTKISEKITKSVHKIVEPILKNELENFIDIESKILSNCANLPLVKNSKISKEEFILFDMYNENIDKDDFTDSHTFENSFSSNIRHFRQNNLLALESVAIANQKAEFNGIIRKALEQHSPSHAEKEEFKQKGSMGKYVSNKSAKIKQKIGFDDNSEIKGLEKVFETSQENERSPQIKKSFNNFVDNDDADDHNSSKNKENTNKNLIAKVRTLQIDELYPVMICNQCDISQEQAIQDLVKPYIQYTQLTIHENVYNAIKLWDNFVFLIFEFKLYKTNNKIALKIFSQFRDFMIRYNELHQK